MRYLAYFYMCLWPMMVVVAEDYTFFERNIRPVFVERCYECHSHQAKKLRGNLYLDSRSGWQRGGDSGPAIVPGEPENSLLLTGLSYHDPDFQMPPKGRLPKSVVDAFRSWIAAGAPDPREAEGAEAGSQAEGRAARTKDWWSFQPVRKPSLPAVNHSEWPRDEIDRFVLRKLEDNQLAPAAEAAREALLRRVHFDLSGLPPTPYQVRNFLARGDLDWVIRDLLKSPQFGERWGRHWLDVARFAESSGGGRSIIFKEAWRYRDYVIDSFNHDKPYDQFVREQLAGDLLPFETAEQRHEQLVATGYLMLAPTNFENQDKEALDLEVVDEQLDTLGRTFMGMTIGCARCHDHKFDPISAEDYYAMAGILFSTDCISHANVSALKLRDLPAPPDVQKQLDERKAARAVLDSRKKALIAQEKEINSALEGKGKGNGAAVKRPAGILVDDSDARKVGEWKDSVHKPNYVGAGYIHDMNGGKGARSVHFTATFPSNDTYEVFFAYNEDTSRSHTTAISIHHAGGTKELKLDQTIKPNRFKTFVSLGRYAFAQGEHEAFVVSNADTAGFVIVDAVLFVPQSKQAPSVAGVSPDADYEKHAAELKVVQEDLKNVTEEIKRFTAQKSVEQPKALAVQDRSKPADTAFRIRGAVHKKGELVPRGFLSAASWGEAAIKEGSGRLELGHWLTDPQHPLTARVMVNRIWYHLMGEGLVRTVDNFGSTGEEPTHPELLDYLATEFVADGWSVKRLVRRIMLSRAYAMRSEGSAEGEHLDPDNLLLWRAHHRRLDSEAMRDAMMFISGQLSEQGGGRTFPANLSSVFGYKFTSNQRSVYLPIFRNNLPDIFEVFDFADANRVAGKRNSSTLPTQALYMMNSPFVSEQSRFAAERLMSHGESPAGDVDTAFLQTLGRYPLAAEREQVQGFLGASPSVETWAAVFHSLFSSMDFRFLR